MIKLTTALLLFSSMAPAGAAPTGPTGSVRVTLSRPVYSISAQPSMPRDVTAVAQVAGLPPGTPPPTVFTWHVSVDWAYSPYPTHHSAADRRVVHASPYTVDFGSQVRGGTLTVMAETTVAGRVVSGQAKALITGVNPDRGSVLSLFPHSRFGLIASKIGMAESGLRQFTPAGMPQLSRTNDVGIMQLNAPSGSITSADQVWDWRANVARGLDMLRGKRRTTVLASRGYSGTRDVDPTESGGQVVACVNTVRAFAGLDPVGAPAAPPLSDQPGSGMASGDLDRDSLRVSQVERDAIRRYNGGREFARALEPDTASLTVRDLGWQVDPGRGGVHERSGDPEYVRHVLAAHSGLRISEPAGRHGRSHHRRRRHRRG